MIRFGVSLERGLLERFDAFVHEARHRNRSAALREIIRDHLVGRSWCESAGPIAAVVSMVYHNRARHVTAALQAVLTRQRAYVVGDTSYYVHDQYTVRVLILHGMAPHVRAVADALLGCKGVVHGSATPLMPGPPCK